jgi:aminopeptidase N
LNRLLQLSIATVVFATVLCGQVRTYQSGVSVLHYDFSIALPDTGRVIDGYALVTVLRSGAVDYLVLDLVNLRVDSVFVRGKVANFMREPGVVNIPLGSPPRRLPDTVLVAVRYGGEVKDGLIIHADAKGRWYAFGDNWPTRARYWIPTLDDPSIKATVSWNITASSDRKVVANGELLEEKILPPGKGMGSKPRMLTRWKTSRPIPPYLMVIAVGPMISFDLGLTARGLSEFPPGVKQTVYALPEMEDYLPGPFKSAGEIVELYSRMIAPFPYEKLAHVQSFTRFGGMENASAIFYADEYFRRRSTNPGVIAHETSHQWFGDAVTPRTWGHLWLSEGFASYFEQLWVEKSAGESAFEQGMKQMRDEIILSRDTYERPVIDTLQTVLLRLLNSNSYQKGAWVLHMVRSFLGDSLFFSAVSAYYVRHRHGTATSDDLCEQFEQVSHTNLRWFFDQWLRRPGLPEITTRWDFNQDLHTLTVQVDQGNRFLAYHFPLKVEIQTADGRSRIVTLDIPAQSSVRLPVPIQLESAPVKLIFDPHVELLAIFKQK